MTQIQEGGAAGSVEEAMAETLIAGAGVGEATIDLRDPAAGMDFQAHTPSGHELVIDTGAEHGGHDLGVQPLELLLVALAGCTGMDVISILRKKRQVVTGYRVRVAGAQQQDHPRVYTEIAVQHIVSGPNLDPKAVARAVELSATKYCPVSAMLSRACTVTHRYTIVQAEAEPDPGVRS